MAKHNDLGKWGEQIACDYLISKGYAIAAQNVRMGHNEIDIIAIKDTRIVFVEVKTRHEYNADITKSLDLKKERHLCNAAEAYLKISKVPFDPQIDVILITGTPETGAKVEHMPDAIRPRPK